MKTVWYMCENTGTNEKELRACKINPCIYGQLVLDKGVMNMEKRQYLQQLELNKMYIHM